ncbi:serine/threonine-protein phosphatase 6 regulatory ankyrin repeat subunit c [Phtheirospermum japonicum]|uniref:Serine/threonine-protein phosphatase 6 regulatory ankyrin repeat subunit c n=1 Tax=Phtheirospermum japonicum TaxID=374723 RepID=A0A830BTT1_9LAMI|nr:serine/threonine-protein phosphatase 6 regulatory ankyrin repeat subunit c [Phtheirospermum japonicum]
MPPQYFPLRWESTGDQWWFASPIDCAAANGHYDLVRELIQIDNNLIFKLTSLARVRRLETVWDDDGGGGGWRSNAVARCRSRVARNLLRDCENLRGHNSLIRAGYGGWLLYTAASAGDLVFVRELLDRDPLLVFGEGEYGVTDVFYAAARSRSGEVFRTVLDCCLAAVKGRREEVPSDFRWEMMNRAVHAAARGGSLGILMELLGDGSDVLAYRDNQGSTVLHTAAGRGQVEVVKNLISSYDIISSGRQSRQHRLACGGIPWPSTRRRGSYIRISTFRLTGKSIFLRKLIAGNFVKTEHIINAQNKDGRTPLHTAIIEDVQTDIVELIISARYIDLNIRDGDGNTPLDILNQRPRSASSEILIKRSDFARVITVIGKIHSLTDDCLRYPLVKIISASAHSSDFARVITVIGKIHSLTDDCLRYPLVKIISASGILKDVPGLPIPCNLVWRSCIYAFCSGDSNYDDPSKWFLKLNELLKACLLYTSRCVVKNLISSYDIISSVDNRGNTALHVAAYRGHLPVVEALISASPPSASSINNHGDTFLHMAVAGFRSPSFIRLDRQIDLLRKLIAGNFVKTEHIINAQNKDGRTPLHTAIIEDVQTDIVELIISARYIDLNIRDGDGNTPLDILNQRPRSASSEILIKRLVSAGGFFSNGRDQIQIQKSRNALVSHLRLHGIGSPGTSFRIPDADIILQAGIEDNRRSSCDFTDYGNYSGEIGAMSSTSSIPNSSKFKKMSSMDRANVRFKSFLRWLGKKDKNGDKSDFEEDKLSFKSYSMCSNSSLQNSPVPLRQQFSKLSNLPSNKRIMSLQGNIPSPSTKKKFVAHDARQVLPKSNLGSPCSVFSESSWPTPNLERGSVGPSSSNPSPDLEKFKMKRKLGSFNLRSMNNYFCIGAHGLAVEKFIKSQPRCENQQSLVV